MRCSEGKSVELCKEDTAFKLVRQGEGSVQSIFVFKPDGTIKFHKHDAIREQIDGNGSVDDKTTLPPETYAVVFLEGIN